MTKQLAFFFDASSCSGCKTCQVACKDKHDAPMGVRWRRVYEVCGGAWKQQGKAWIPELFAYHMSVACNHCEDPVCAKSCPNKAIVKQDNGVVLIDPDKCMGCKYCEWTCPYGALQFDSLKKVMTKCTFCADYLEQGKPPACVSACPMRALEFGELEELERRHGKNKEIYPFPEAFHTQPAVVVKPHPTAKNIEKHKPEIANKEEVRP
ncbi:MAG: DMSO/selenate family reductase complex B subunit [Bacteroidales bacterium]